MAPSGGDPPLEGGPAVAAADEYLSMTDYFIIERKTLFDSTCNDSGFHFIAVISDQFVPMKIYAWVLPLAHTAGWARVTLLPAS